MSADARPVKSSITFEAAPNFVAPSGVLFFGRVLAAKNPVAIFYRNTIIMVIRYYIE